MDDSGGPVGSQQPDDHQVVLPPGYPADWEADVVLRDGGTCHVRPIRPDDRDRLQELHLSQSERSTYLRFFAPLPRLSEKDLDRFTQVDYVDRTALIAVVDDKIVAVGRYDVVTPGEAEVAFNVSDHHQGRGLGSVLLEHLAAAARERDITRFVAEVLPENRAMVQVFKDAGYEVKHHFDDGVISLGFGISPTEKSIAVTASRERRAEAASLRALMNARSVAVVGAGPKAGGLGNTVVLNLVGGGYTGVVYPVHPRAKTICGLAAYPSVSAIGQDVDLVVVTTRAELVHGIVAGLPAGRVRGVLVLSDGFADAGSAGRERQNEVVGLARARGIRMIGPASLGMVNTDPQVRLDASLIPPQYTPGSLALFSQSGGLGLVLLSEAVQRGLGVAGFVSVGHRADVSGNDLLQFWGEDDRAEVIAMYTETSGNPRKFSRIARWVSRSKPIIIVRSWAGTVVSSRRSTAPKAAFESLLRQAGVIRADDVHHLADVAELLLHQPLPEGMRVGVLANAEVLAHLTTAAATSWGLELADEQALVAITATAEEVRAGLEEAFDRQDVDIVIATLMPAPHGFDPAVLQAVSEVAAARGKTFAACLVGPRRLLEELPAGDHVPAYATPEDAVRAVASVAKYAQWRRQPDSPLVEPDGCDPVRARKLVEEVLGSTSHPSGVVLRQDLVTSLLGCYGIRLCPTEWVHDVERAVLAAEQVGYPVALKYADRLLREREDIVGARLNIYDEEELRAEFTVLNKLNHPATGKGYLVQPMVAPGVPVAIRSMEDALFGPVVSFGLDGDAMDLLEDVSFRICPVTEQDVRDLVREVKASPRLFGHLGAPPLSVSSLEDLIARVSRLCEDLPEIADMQLEPVLVTAGSVEPLQCRIRLALPNERETGLVRKL